MNRKDACQCGREKDARAKQCLVCTYPEKTEKVCPGCDTVYPIEEYNTKTKNGKRRSRCKKCRAAYSKWRKANKPETIRKSQRLYASKNPERIRAWAIRSRWKKWGFDPDEVQRFRSNHKGGCSICGTFDKLVIDHNHSTKKLRGILCAECNFGLGKFKDDIKLLESAIDYLKKTTHLAGAITAMFDIALTPNS